jgi:hypothetical protein
VTTHIGLNGVALCGESRLMALRVTVNVDEATCTACLWASCANTWTATNMALARLKALHDEQAKRMALAGAEVHRG